MKTTSRLIFLFALGFAINSCRGTDKPQPDQIEPVENFDAFNIRFHADSIFQLSRISFPLAGHFADAASNHEGWTAGKWQMLKIPVGGYANTTEYMHNIIKADSTVTEMYWIDNSGFKVETRFALIDKKWFLVFYDDINL